LRLASRRDARDDRHDQRRGIGQAKATLLGDLFARATPREADFLRRVCLIGELRQGALEGLMIDAVAAAAEVAPAVVRRAAWRRRHRGRGSHRDAGGRRRPCRFRIALFQPIAPMLAQPADDIDDAMARIGGEAAWSGSSTARACRCTSRVTTFASTRARATTSTARRRRSSSSRDAFRRAVILDGEAIVLGPTGAPYPFQETMSRFGTRAGHRARRRCTAIVRHSSSIACAATTRICGAAGASALRSAGADAARVEHHAARSSRPLPTRRRSTTTPRRADTKA
jgi:ATP-dependent DNA ligase